MQEQILMRPSPPQNQKTSSATTNPLSYTTITDFTKYTNLHYLQYNTWGMHEVGFEPTRLTPPGLKSGSLDHSDIRAGAPVRFRTADLRLIRPML